MNRPPQMTKIEKVAMEIACTGLMYSGNADRVFDPENGADARTRYAEQCRDLAEKLMDPVIETEAIAVGLSDFDQILSTIDKVETIEIWTDGACKPNPGRGGWGVYIEINGEAALSACGCGGNDVTNNQMELMAAIKALEIMPLKIPFTLYTDSQYVRNGITKWCAGWIRNGWKNSKKKPVKNIDLWKQLVALNQNLRCRWEWVKGHSGNKGNTIADQLATDGMAKVILKK